MILVCERGEVDFSIQEGSKAVRAKVPSVPAITMSYAAGRGAVNARDVE